MSSIIAALFTTLVLGLSPRPALTLDAAGYRDRVYACWLGKNIGGTLGVPTEGQREPHNLTFFDPVPTSPSANDDLDLQMLWLKALEEVGPGLTCRDLGRYWLKFVPVDWNEYGIGKANMRLGFDPPVSGQIRNVWRDSNGAWIRSEIWACVSPGRPDIAARYAWEDASVDHGSAEGTYAAMFTAALESAAFVEKDRDRLIEIALGYIPPASAMARAIRAVTAAKRGGLDWKAAREVVVRESESTGWFMAPRNVAFTVLGWLYGEDDFGKSLCAAVNCGDDTDCTGATLGSLWGILHGTAGIPERWRKPVGEGIKTVAIAGFPPPADLNELTDRTVAMARRVIAHWKMSVAIVEGAGDRVSAGARSVLVNAPAARALWGRSALCVTTPLPALGVSVETDLVSEADLTAGQARRVAVHVRSLDGRARRVTVSVAFPGASAAPASGAVSVPAGRGAAGTFACDLTQASVFTPVAAGTVRVEVDGKGSSSVPFAVPSRVGVRSGDMALRSAGATVTADSELERERGSAAKAIDGEVATSGGFEGKRWHSALTPHPHWLAVKLAAAKEVGRVIVHFADPSGYPVDFDLQTSDDGQTWTTVRSERGWADNRGWEREIGPVTARWFRVQILRSSSAVYPDAAQLSEVELLPK